MVRAGRPGNKRLPVFYAGDHTAGRADGQTGDSVFGSVRLGKATRRVLSWVTGVADVDGIPGKIAYQGRRGLPDALSVCLFGLFVKV